ALLLQLFEPDPVLVVAGLPPVEVADEQVERIGRRVEVLREAVDEVPLAEEAVLHPAADRDVALRLQLRACSSELRPRLRRMLRVEPSLPEVRLVIGEAEPDRVEADAIVLALVYGEVRRAGMLERRLGDEAVERGDVAEPHVLHVVDAV